MISRESRYIINWMSLTELLITVSSLCATCKIVWHPFCILFLLILNICFAVSCYKRNMCFAVMSYIKRLYSRLLFLFVLIVCVFVYPFKKKNEILCYSHYLNPSLTLFFLIVFFDPLKLLHFLRLVRLLVIATRMKYKM